VIQNDKYYCGCDVGSTYGKAMIIDDSGKVLGSSIVRSKVDPEDTARISIAEAIKGIPGLDEISQFTYLVGTGYGRNEVPFANENISEISCHALGVFTCDPEVRSIVDIGGQDVKGIGVADDGMVRDFCMNDKCAAGTGLFFEGMSRAFEINIAEFSNLSLMAKKVIPITSQCSVFAETEVISLLAMKNSPADIAAGIQQAVAKRCLTMLMRVGIQEKVTVTGGCAKNYGLIQALESILRTKLAHLPIDPQLMGALGAAIYARRKALVKADGSTITKEALSRRGMQGTSQAST
jgi:predicted CoA-substrate-specific enzyme activase